MQVDTKPLRSIIVDDEQAARDLLVEMLAEHPDIEIIGTYGDSRQAIEAIVRDKPDLLFLDVQMPRRNGFEVLESLRQDALPATIFVTAYDEYAVRAFDVSAVDYLLKPFDEDRLRRAVDRVVSRKQHVAERSEPPGQDALAAVLDSLRTRDTFTRKLPVRVGERILLVRVEDISWFEAQGKYVRLYLGTESHLIRTTMQRLEDSLDPRRFLRVSRSAIINIDHLKHSEPWTHGEFVLMMRSGHQVVSTHGYREGIQRLLRAP